MKLKLEVEDLQVESFTTGGEQERSGTVHAHNHTWGAHTGCANTCVNTCWLTCPATCQVSCDGADTCYQETCGGPCQTNVCV